MRNVCMRKRAEICLGKVYPNVNVDIRKNDPSSTAQSLNTKDRIYGDHIVVLAFICSNSAGSLLIVPSDLKFVQRLPVAISEIILREKYWLVLVCSILLALYTSLP